MLPFDPIDAMELEVVQLSMSVRIFKRVNLKMNVLML